MTSATHPLSPPERLSFAMLLMTKKKPNDSPNKPESKNSTETIRQPDEPYPNKTPPNGSRLSNGPKNQITQR